MRTITKSICEFRGILPLLCAAVFGISVTVNVSAQPFVSGLSGAAGSTVAPDGYLYVVEGFAGAVTRIDPDTGDTSPLITGLPTRQFPGFGGPVDVAFIGDTAYVLVTMVGPPFGAEVDGVYRVDGPDSYTIVADIGSWSGAHPPPTGFFLPNGVQYSIEAYRGGLLVADGHHNRILHVSLDGVIGDFSQFDNVVPTGLDVWGDDVLVALAGPAPHEAADGRIVSIASRSRAVSEEAAGAALNVDVERGRGGELYALSQGDWDGVGEGSPAFPDTGALLRRYGNGSFLVVAAPLDRPTSVEIIGNTAYVVTLADEVVKLEGISAPPFGGN